jgi:hypothetical protein
MPMELREALSQIAEIRARVAATERFRGYKAVPVGISGALAMCVAALQSWLIPEPQLHLHRYFALWVCTAILALTAAGSGIWWRWRLVHQPLIQELTRLAISQFVPCLVAGALVTLAIARHSPEVSWLLPGLWQVLFSLGIFASYRLLPKSIVGVGVFYMLAGVLNLAISPEKIAFSPWCMGLPFGIGQLAIAGILYWHLEREDGIETEQR